ncbi:MAG TPA: hypothetical protein VH684_20605 [Xanthobacteraceae bacterium]|jgi:hypothetical protein
MEQRKGRKSPTTKSAGNREPAFDFDALLHPAQAFDHPADVVNDSDLTLSEKRAILSSWASDACAVEAVPALRRPPGAQPVAFDDIMDALKALDRQAQGAYNPRPHYRRVLENRVPGVFGRKSRSGNDDRNQPLN